MPTAVRDRLSELTVSFRYTAHDLARAQRLMRRLRPREAWLYRMVVPAFALAATLGVLLYFTGHRLLGILCIAGFGLLTSLSLAMPNFQANSAFKRFPYLQQEITAEFGENGIGLTTSAGRAILPWSAFSAFAEDRQVLMLARNDNHVQVFPKRAFSPAELDAVRAMLQTRINSSEQE